MCILVIIFETADENVFNISAALVTLLLTFSTHSFGPTTTSVAIRKLLITRVHNSSVLGE
jgi:hypothetical protein